MQAWAVVNLVVHMLVGACFYDIRRCRKVDATPESSEAQRLPWVERERGK